jgi:ABC-type lipoprotein release transport system permease subunit
MQMHPSDTLKLAFKARPGGPPGRTSSTSASSTIFTLVFTPELIAFSLLFPIGVALLAGLYPAWRASRMNAVVALKCE